MTRDDEDKKAAEMKLSATDLLRKIRAEADTLFHQKMEAAGGPEQWFRDTCPHAAEVAMTQSDFDVGEVVRSETLPFWQGIEARLSECARCVPQTAACADSAHRFSPGRKVKLVVLGAKARAEERRCERYLDWRLSERMQRIGVDARFKHLQIQVLKRPEYIERSLNEFLGSGIRELWIQGAFACEYAVALLRLSIQQLPHESYSSVHVPTLMRHWRAAIASNNPMDLDVYLDPRVLVLDQVTEDEIRADWFRKELSWIYDRRRADEKKTIFSSVQSLSGEIFPGVSVLEV